MEIIQSLQDASIPKVLVIAGIFFIFLAIAGGITGKVNVPENRQKQSLLAGIVFLISGLLLIIIPTADTGISNDMTASTDVGVPVNNDGQSNEVDVQSNGQVEDWPVRYSKETLNGLAWPTHDNEDQYGRETFTVSDSWQRAALEAADSSQAFRPQIPINPIIEFDITFKATWLDKSGHKNCVGLTFQEIASTYYLIYFCDTGKVGFSAYNEEQDNEWNYYNSANLFSGFSKTTNIIRIRCERTRAMLFLNDQLVLTQPLSISQAGNIRFYMDVVKNSKAEVLFENVEIRAPSS